MSPSRCSGATSSAARSAGPIARARSFYFASVEGLATRSAETRVAHVPTAAERAGDFSASGLRAARPAHRAAVPGQPDSSRSARSGGRERGGALSGSEPRGRRPEPRDLAARAARRAAADRQDRSPPRGASTPVFVRYSLTARRSRRSRSRRVAATCPASASSVVDVGQNPAAGVSQVLPRGVFNELRVGWNRLRRDNAPLATRARTASRRSASRARRCRSADLGYPAFVAGRLRDARRRSEPAGVAAHAARSTSPTA